MNRRFNVMREFKVGGRHVIDPGAAHQPEPEPAMTDEQAAESFARAFAAAAGVNAAALEQLAGLSALRQALLERELGRASDRYGAESPRALGLMAELQANALETGELQAEAEASSVRPAEVEKDGALFHGRVLDEAGRGLAGMEVRLEDAEGRPLDEAVTVRTDAAGYYAFSLPAARTAELHKTGAQAAVSVLDGKGGLIARSEAAPIERGAQVFAEAGLNRLKLSGVRPQAAPVRPDRPTEGEWVVRGRVVDDSDAPLEGMLVGLGDKEQRFAEKLGTAATDAEGGFELTIRAADFRAVAEKMPELFLTVKDREGALRHQEREPLRFEAGRRDVFHIHLPKVKRGRGKPDEPVG